MKRFVRGDWDGFFALGLDNLIMLLLMSSICLGPLAFSPDFYFGRILPANAIGLLIGNLFYARQARRLAEQEGRDDVCALPYGINLFTIIVFSFGVMLPARLQALQNGASPEQAQTIAWHAGLIACFVSGLIEFGGAFIAKWLRDWTPRAALLASIAGIGLIFLGGLYFFRAFTYPVIGFTTLALTFAVYFGKVRFKGGVPAGLVILGFGTAIAWTQLAIGSSSVVPARPWDSSQLGLHLPIPAIGALIDSLPYVMQFLPVAISMGFLSLVGSLMNLESAESAGDAYDTRSSLIFNGLGSLGTAFFGSPFPTTIYIGHPGWKALGARAGYSTINAIFFGVVLLTGLISAVAYLIPIEAGMAILIWIGLTILVQCFGAVPKPHVPAIAVGLLPALGALAYLMMFKTWSALGYGAGGTPLPEGIMDRFVGEELFAEGIFALNAGYIYCSLILTAVVAAICDRKFHVAAVWALVGAALSALGFMHGYAFGPGGYTELLQPAWKWVWGYAILALVLAVTPLVTQQEESDPD